MDDVPDQAVPSVMADGDSSGSKGPTAAIGRACLNWIVRVLVDEPRRAFGTSTRTDQERHAATVAGAESEQMHRQLLKLLIGQIGDDACESFERLELADVADIDVRNERVRVAMQIKRRDIGAGAAQFK